MREEVRKAISLRESGDPEAAGSLLSVFLRENPDEAEAHYQMAWSLDVRGMVVEGERRWTFFAKTRGGRIIFVVYTMREDKVRVISARDAEDDEKRIYRRG